MDTKTTEDSSSKIDRKVESITEDNSSVTENLWSSVATSSAWCQAEKSAQDKCGRSMCDVPAAPIVHDYQVKGPMPAQVEREIDSMSGTARLVQHPEQRSADRGARTETHACGMCGPVFSTRKSLLRHLRTVHQPRAFRCPSCKANFTRNDILVRHTAEHHNGNSTRVKCIFCERNISERAYHEHLGSQTCIKARLKMRNPNFDDLRFGFPGQDDDAFLVTIRMFLMLNLKLSYNVDTGDANLTSEAFVRNETGELSRKIQQLAVWEHLYVRVLSLTRRQIEQDITAVYISAAMWASALLLGLLAFSRGCDEDARAHWKGAADVLGIRHNSACECNSYESCKRWRKPTSRDPTIALVARILEERGFMNERAAVCMQVKMSEDDTLRNICIHHFKMLEAFLKN